MHVPSSSSKAIWGGEGWIAWKLCWETWNFLGATIWEVYSRHWLLVPLVFKDNVSAEWDLELWDIGTDTAGVDVARSPSRHRAQRVIYGCAMGHARVLCPVIVLNFMVIFTYFHSVHGWISIFLRFTQITVNFIMFHHLPYLGKLLNKWPQIEGEFPWISRW